MSTTSKSKSMTEGPLAKTNSAGQSAAGSVNLLQILFNMSDVAVVGRFAGSTALGAVGSTSIFVTLFTGFLIGLGNGINVLVARFYGARNAESVHKTVHSALLVSLLAGVLLLVVGLFGSPALLRLLNTKEDLLPGDSLPAGVLFGNAGAGAVQLRQRSVQRHWRNPEAPALPLVRGCAEHSAEPVFCDRVQAGRGRRGPGQYHCTMCIGGADSARSDPRSATCYALDLQGGALDLNHDPAGPDAGRARGACKTAIFAIANLFIQAGVNSFDSLMVKGNSAAANADALVYDAMAAFLHGLRQFYEPELRCRQAGPRKEKSYFIALAYSFGLGAGAGRWAAASFGRQFLALFTTESVVIDAGMKRILVMGLGLLHLGFHGLHDCRLPRAGPDRRPHRYRYSGVLRIPRGVGLHDLCPLPHDPGALHAVSPAPGR